MKNTLLTTTILSALCANLLLAEAPKVLDADKRTFEQSKFMPDISLVIDGSYTDRNVEDHELGHLEIPGVSHGYLGGHDHDGHSESPYNGNNGFNLNYAELVLSSSVDPYFNLDGVFHFSEDAVEIEEAYFTSNLPAGFRLRGGKFSSDFGRINAQHHHYWDFGDAPLVNQAFLGLHGLNDKGLQLQYVAPLSHYLMVGAEILQGKNENMFGLEGIEDVYDDAKAGNLMLAYLKTAHDFDNTTMMIGLSYAQGDTKLDHRDDETAHAFDAQSKLYGLDLTVKHSFDSYSDLTWQSEIIKREMDGTRYGFDESGALTGSASMIKEQAGYYTQLVYGHNKNWKMGVRYDNIYQNDVIVGGTNQNMEEGLGRYSAMIEYHPSEFSRIRLQYNQNNALFEEDENIKINTLTLQYNLSIGAHGAHSF